MQVLHVYKTYYPTTTGGCEQAIRSLTKHTSRMGCQNKLVTIAKNAGYMRDASLEVHYLPVTFELSSCPVSWKLLLQFREHAKKADVIHFHFPWPFADLLYLLSMVNKPTVVTYQSDIVRQKLLKPLYTPVMKAFLSRVDRIILSSDNYLNSSRDIQPYRDKCSVIPLGICQQDYPVASQELLKHWKERIGDNFMLFVGVLRSYKGLDYLIEAVKETSVPLVIVGAGSEEKRLKLKCIGMKNIIFIGYVSEEDKIALIQLCRALILPSHLRSEAFGVCLVEGLLYGKPLISTELNTGTSFVNQHQVTGLVVPPSNVVALREAILTLHGNGDLAEQYGANARQHYLKYFQAEKMAQEYFKVYHSLFLPSPACGRRAGDEGL